ncbi:MAG: 6-phosphofructokinase [Rhodospirillales bacterium]|nr:MAG: 6-phosphofructokinase [Rhodospirillales bacterium]
MHIAVLTGGGDVPGLNPAIKAIVTEASARGWNVTGFRRGWAGPLNCDLDNPEASSDWVTALGPDVVRHIDRTGGTVLHTTRTNPSNVRAGELPDFLRSKYSKAGEMDMVDCTEHVLAVLTALKVDVLIAIGGDDTLSYAARLFDEGVPTMCIPKTMDNDVFGTDYCIGFSTCVNRSVDFINRLRTPAGSHERFLVVEMFGRNSGESALITGYLSDADRTLIAEVPFDIERVAQLLEADRERNSSHYAIVVVSEGASPKGGAVLESGEADAFGHRKLGGIGRAVGDALKERTGVDVMVQSLAYLVRAGMPDAMDLMVGRNFGTMTIQLIEAGKSGLMTAIQDGRYTTEAADICTRGKRNVDVAAMYDPEAYHPRIAQVSGMPMFLK